MNTTTKAQRTNKRQDAIWEKAKRAQAETAAAAPEAPRKDCTHNRMIETHDNPTWAWQCADCGYIYGKHGTPKPNFAGFPDSFEYGCPDCQWWDGGSEPDFGNCPSCGQPKVVWNMTHAEAENDPETQFEESCREILYS